MEQFIKGDVVVVPFPFSDLSQSKKRPALVVQHFDGEDLLFPFKKTILQKAH